MKKTVFITGATAGIGAAIAKKFAAAGHRLVICGRREERLSSLTAKLALDYSVEAFAFPLDVRNVEQVKEAIANIPSPFADIDILVNNAGLASGLSPIQEGELLDWERMIDTNIKGLLYVTREIAPLMVSKKSGHIINIGSIAGKEVYPQGNVYCATKHAVDALTKGMRLDLLPHNIRVSQISPGMVETEFSNVRFHGDTERAAAVYEGYNPLTAEDIADATFYIANVPPHVCINDLWIMPTTQANSYTKVKA
ncbi:MAG: SDR family NAD(P)-dependent oxidoreductase [Schleiferiaceae bacterium]|nr:SDR family NAD(P)-dependent oxidoreductase [Schleiferiaceae bacterium]